MALLRPRKNKCPEDARAPTVFSPIPEKRKGRPKKKTGAPLIKTRPGNLVPKTTLKRSKSRRPLTAIVYWKSAAPHSLDPLFRIAEFLSRSLAFRLQATYFPLRPTQNKKKPPYDEKNAQSC